jgi:hypothetical protein
MKIVFFAALFLTLVSCSNKEWSKDYISKKCKTEMRKNEQSKIINDEQLSKICDCAGDKMITKYKSEAEANRDTLGMQDIPLSCALEVLTGGNK